MSTRSPQNYPQIVRLRPHAADASAGERFTDLARLMAAQASDASLETSVRLQFLREQSRLETLAAAVDADAILADSPWPVLP